MLSKVLALLIRALRVDARRLPSHVMRLGLLGIVVIVLFYSQFIGLAMGAPGLWFFKGLSWINFIFGSLAGCLLFSTSITEEKEQQTLGLLRMADVGPLSLLLGKSAPRLLAVLLILSVQFPFTLLAITLGGVSWPQVHAAFWTLFAHIILMGMIGVLCSVVFRRSAAAVAVSFVLISGAVFGPSIVLGFLSLGTPGPGASGWTIVAYDWLRAGAVQASEVSGAKQLSEVLASTFQGPIIGKQVVVNATAGLAVFGIAWLLFDVCNRTLDASASPAQNAVSKLLGGKRRSRRAWQFAIVGKDFHQFAWGFWGFGVRLVGYAVVFGLLLILFNLGRLHRIDLEEYGEMVMALTLYFFLPLELILLAARVFRGETREGTWPALMSLPLSLPEIAYAKVLGSLIAVVPLLLHFMFGAILNHEDVFQIIDELMREPPLLLWMTVVLLGFLVVLHLATLYSLITNTWLGILLSLASGFLLLMLTYMAVLLPFAVWAMSTGGMGRGFDEEFYFGIAAIIVGVIYCGLVVAVHFAIAARLRADSHRE